MAFAVAWGPLTFGGLPSWSFLVTQAVVMAALVLWLARLWTAPARLLWPPVCWAVVVFLLYALVRCRLVLLEYPARMELIQIVVYASLFFVIVNNLERRESASVITFCLMAVALGLSILAIFQFAAKAQTFLGFARRAQFINRGTGTYINPNHLADLLAMALPLALAYAFLSRFSSTLKVFFAYCALAMLAGIGTTLSRGGLATTAIILAVFCLMMLCQRGYGIAAFASLAVLAALGVAFATQFSSVQQRFGQAFKGGQVADIRAAYWPAAIHLFEEHPWWGQGPGHFDSAFARYRPPAVQIRPVYAHNDYLNTLCEYGIPGLAIIMAAIVLLYYGAWRTWPALRVEDPVRRELLRSDKSAFFIGACIGLLAILVHCGLDFNMHVPANAVVAITLMALITAHWRFATERFWVTPHVITKIFLTLIIGAAVAWLGMEGARRTREAFWLHRSTDEKAPWNERLAGLENACAAEPSDYVNAYNLGEYYRLVSLEGNPGYELDARRAMTWYAISMKLNPLDAFVPMRYGMCLDWIGQTNRAGAYFDLAAKMDPNNSLLAYYEARHCIEANDLPAAKRWFEHSMKLEWTEMTQAAYDHLKERMADPYHLYH